MTYRDNLEKLLEECRNKEQFTKRECNFDKKGELIKNEIKQKIYRCLLKVIQLQR